MLGKIEHRRTRMRWLGSIINSMDLSLSKLQEMVKEREAWRAAVHKVLDVTWPLNKNNFRHEWPTGADESFCTRGHSEGQ